jgi:hypothetical protein
MGPFAPASEKNTVAFEQQVIELIILMGFVMLVQFIIQVGF